MNLKTKTIITLIVAGLGLLLIWAYLGSRKERAKEAERERPVETASRVSFRNGETVISLDQETIAKSGITTAPLAPETRRAQIRAYGMAVDPQALSDLRSNYEKAEATANNSGTDLERERSLRRQGAVSDEVVQNAEATFRVNKAAVEALAAQAQQQWGDMIARWVKENSPQLKRLLQLEDVLLQVSLPRGTSVTSPPETASIQTTTGQVVSAKLISHALRSDPRVQGESFFYVSSRRESQLLPGMTVVVLMPAGGESTGVIVPANAIVWWQGKAWVYLETNPAEFTRRSVPTDFPVEEGWFVRNGLAAGERIVTVGAQFLLSEEFRNQIQVGEEKE